jgi:hypothetical protein
VRIIIIVNKDGRERGGNASGQNWSEGVLRSKEMVECEGDKRKSIKGVWR